MTYEGSFIPLRPNGNPDKRVKHGIGVMKWQDGREYQGQFAFDKMHGEGTMSWPTGAKYVGQYCDNSKGGLGKLTLPDGSSFEGNWYKGTRHGDFLYIDPVAGAFRMEYECDEVVRSERLPAGCRCTLKPAYETFILSEGSTELPGWKAESADPCCICLGELCSGETCCKMPCDHVFHKECIENWTRRKNSCPLCMQNIPPYKLQCVSRA